MKIDGCHKNVPEDKQNIICSPEEEMNDINKEISISYGQSNIIYDQEGNITEIFSYSVACDIMNDDPEPQSVIDCQNRYDWAKWKEAMQAELNSLNKRNVFWTHCSHTWSCETIRV